MATFGNSYIDLIDLYQANGRYGSVLPVIEALHTLNPIMEDAVYVECNAGTEHERAIRTQLPEAAWGRLYQGTPYSKSARQKVKDTTGVIELQCGIDDRELKDLSSENAAKVRENEAEPVLESMAQMAQQAFFYGNVASNPLGIQGLAPRYSSLTGGGPSDYIIDAGGTGADLMSMWIVTWGQNQTSMLYPKGTSMGVQREDMGRVPVTDANGTYYVETERFRQQLGATVGDYRFNCRIANIDVSDTLAGTVDIVKLLIQAYYKMENRRNVGKRNGGMISPGKTVIYCRREAKQALHLDSSNKRTGDNFLRLRPDEQHGREVMSFLDIPIKECDGLVANETRVV